MGDTKKIELKTDLPKLLEVTANEVRNPGISIGFALSLDILRKVAKRALASNDLEIIYLMKRIGFITDKDFV